MDVSGQTVCPGHLLQALVFSGLETVWALELVWMFWRRESSLATAKI